ncbi:hypothetical protein B0H11DRAFT_2408084 [Mycena galericulata]|nr:hypothetical protein B0H11DRAFT_2408084 [Mycena galericulata]
MILEMKNVDGSPLSVLGVYAPNRPYQNAAFWKQIKNWFVAHPTVRKPDILGGDTNFVEDPIDRLPAHPDSTSATEAFEDLKRYLGLVDGWRETFPTTRAYTFLQPAALGGAQSRIDRIYIKRDLFEDSFEWEIQAVGIETDHRMVTMRLTTEEAPTIGHGRFVCPPHLMRDDILTKFIYEEGLKLYDAQTAVLQKEVDGQWNPNHNCQTLYAEWKIKVCDKMRERAKIVVPKIVQEIAELKNKMDLIVADDDLSEEEKSLSAQVRNRLEGEVISTYWTQINKPHKPRELIQRLRKNTNPEDPPQYETNSKKMASMARDYHDRIQSDRARTPRAVREGTIETVLGRIKAKITQSQDELLKKPLTLEDVRYALKLSANHKAPGVLAPPNALRVVSIADLIGDLETHNEALPTFPSASVLSDALRIVAMAVRMGGLGLFALLHRSNPDLASTSLSASAPPNALHIVNIAALIGNLGALTSTFPTASAPPNATHVVATIV